MKILEVPEYKAENTIKITKTIKGNDVSLFGAFKTDDEVICTVRVNPRSGAYDFTLIITDDDTGAQVSLPFKRELDLPQDTYTIKLPTHKEALYFYKISYRDTEGEHFCKNPIDEREDFQLTVYDKNYKPPKWFAGGIMYHIFVDRFAKSGKCPKKDYAIMCDDPDAVPQYVKNRGDKLENNVFFGGDIYGIIEKLDYLKSLGVTCLYLSPIFDAYSNHKYDTGNYMEIDSMFGGEEAFDELIIQAKKKDIRVILDGVFNHTGADSIYFNKFGRYPSLGAYQSEDSPYASWYDFEKRPDKYKCWWGIDILPTANKNSESYRDYIFGDNGVVPHYIEKGASGWRLDVADELTDEFIEQIARSAKKRDSEALIIGEVWEDASNKIAYSKRREYLRGHELDSVMNYPFRSAVIEFVKNGDGRTFERTVKTVCSNYPKCVCDNLMNFLGTHDTERILTVLGGDPDTGLSGDILAYKKMSDEQLVIGRKRLKMAYTLIATLPGVPCIYYGDEAGLQGYHDPFNRRFFPWGKEDEEILAFYRKIGKIRTEHADFKDSIIEFLTVTDDFIAYRRGKITVCVNRSDKAYEYDSKKKYTNLLSGENEFITLKPNNCGIYI